MNGTLIVNFVCSNFYPQEYISPLGADVANNRILGKDQTR